MKCHSLRLPILPALALIFFLGTYCGLPAQTAKKKAIVPPPQEESQDETAYSEEEYNALMAATGEKDLEKRGAMMLAFLDKYPKTTLMTYVDTGFETLLDDCRDAKNWTLLELYGEKWLKLRPTSMKALTAVALATQNLGKNERCVECMEEIYAKTPDPSLAKDILGLYKKLNNLAKQIEWTDKIFKMPEFASEFQLRFDFVTKYTESKNYPKAAEYAQLTLKSVDLVKNPDAELQKYLNKVRYNCFYVIGINDKEVDKFDSAIDSFKKAFKAEKNATCYYYIGQCLENLKKVDPEALIAYAKAVVIGGDGASEAKARLETLYKALHDGRDTGIEKKYKQAKEELEKE